MATKRVQIARQLRDMYVNSFLAGPLVPTFARSRAIRAVGHDVHPSATINPSCFLGATNGLTIGPNTFVNYGCFFDLGAPTSIGANCAVGYEAMFITCSHELGDSGSRAAAPTTSQIVIGDGCWIGARVVIMPGVTIGRGTIIAAGSVVTADCEPNSLYAGNPAVLKRALTDQ